MKQCHECSHFFAEENWLCPSCGWAPAIKNEIIEFAPEFAASNNGFNPLSFENLRAIEDQNFWFRARNNIIIWFIGKHFPYAHNFMEIGCGTGYVLSGINRVFPNMILTGTEIFTAGLAQAAARLPNTVRLYQMNACSLPFSEEFDLIGAFDCLEHIDDDEKVLIEISRALKPGGGVIFTVPQHPFLWSKDDEVACHKRRYKRTELQDKMRAAGFEILGGTSFTTLLFPFMLVDRLTKKMHKDNGSTAGLHLPPIINSAFSALSLFEFLLVKAGLRFPFGGSRLVIGIKK